MRNRLQMHAYIYIRIADHLVHAHYYFYWSAASAVNQLQAQPIDNDAKQPAAFKGRPRELRHTLHCACSAHCDVTNTFNNINIFNN